VHGHRVIVVHWKDILLLVHLGAGVGEGKEFGSGLETLSESAWLEVGLISGGVVHWYRRLKLLLVRCILVLVLFLLLPHLLLLLLREAQIRSIRLLPLLGWLRVPVALRDLIEEVFRER
jgi:hypothetical protein